MKKPLGWRELKRKLGKKAQRELLKLCRKLQRRRGRKGRRMFED